MKTSDALAVAAAMAAAVCTAQFPPEPTTADGKTLQQLIDEAPVGKHGGKVVSPEMRELMNIKNGGMVVPKDNGRMILFADARGVGADGFWEEFLRSVNERMHLPMAATNVALNAGESGFALAARLQDGTHPGVVAITGNGGRPAIEVYPEDFIAVVNAGGLGTDARLRKELLRSIAFAFGGAVVTKPRGDAVDNIARPVANALELDAIGNASFAPAQINGILATTRHMGISSAKPVPYVVACKQGWAPEPTNEYQQAIWNKANFEKELGPANRREIRK